MKWYINDIELENTIITVREVEIPWFRHEEEIYKKNPIITNVRPESKPFRLNIKLRSSDRFNAETSIRAELDDCDTVLVKSSHNNVYKAHKSIWIIPSGFNVRDEENQLECELAGIIDERTLHSCDFTTNWTGTSISTDTDTRFGKNAIKDSRSAAGVTLQTFDAGLDLSRYGFISLWHKFSIDLTAQLRLYTNSDYFQWDIADSTSWTHETFDLNSPDSTSGSPSLSNITGVGIYTSGSGSWTTKIGWVYAE